MNWKAFFKLVEIQTKVASFFPMLIGFLYSAYYFGTFRAGPSVLFFASLLCLDMATTALNNFSDHKKAVLRDGYNYLEHNAMNAYNLKPALVRRIILLLFTAALLLGLLLVWQTDVVVLALGLFAGAVALLYSRGPLPISHTPLSEAVSGLLMGGLIFFLAVYIQNPAAGWILYRESYLSLRLDVLLGLFVVSLPLVFGIANIMLANNICDMEDDIQNGRHTLVSYIGKKDGLMLFALNQLGALAILLALMISALFPWTGLVVFMGIPLYWQNLQRFVRAPSKQTTFVSSVKNFVLLAFLMALALIGALFWKK